MAAKKSEYTCIKDETIQNISRKTAELETRANYKDERINQIISDQKRMEEKIDHIAEAVNNLQLQSLKDDKDIDKRVTSLENTVQVIKWIITLLFGSGIIWLIINYIH
ncbi:MAG: hypothetical protein E7Z77_02375 [Methanobrevibacter sp.]|uniref:hypothetical protein n=1 Tax=Methanobrevibacter sp. TaxID=66852 RepID=UPI0025F06B37|nr:hypothetical protein [Methanobrevibacter sp.]MBE6508240.1 hypothetical protein [Methanobrevibacter sp.]